MEASCAGYPTDLDDSRWALVRPLIPAASPIGATRTTSIRAILNAIFYRERSGCPWRMLPRDFPHWRTVYGYYRRWQRDGTWKQVRDRLREESRRRSSPSAAP
jgi:putative transposase